MLLLTPAALATSWQLSLKSPVVDAFSADMSLAQAPLTLGTGFLNSRLHVNLNQPTVLYALADHQACDGGIGQTRRCETMVDRIDRSTAARSRVRHTQRNRGSNPKRRALGVPRHWQKRQTRNAGSDALYPQRRAKSRLPVDRGRTRTTQSTARPSIQTFP